MADIHPAITLGRAAHAIAPVSRLYLGWQSVNPESVVAQNERLL